MYGTHNIHTCPKCVLYMYGLCSTCTVYYFFTKFVSHMVCMQCVPKIAVP